MYTVAFAASKGGVGKTTLVSAFAVEAARKGKVSLYDADMQQSLQRWHELRDDHANISLIDFNQGRVTAEMAVKRARAAGSDWLFIDTPPAIMKIIMPVIEVADFVVIPVKPSPIDIEAVDPVVHMCTQEKKPFVFVINMAASKTGITQGAVKFLSEMGPVLPEMVMQRQAYLASMATGQSGVEVDKTGKCGEEIAPLWKLIQKAVLKHAVNA